MKLHQRVDPPTTRNATAGTNAKPHSSRLTGLFGGGDARGGYQMSGRTKRNAIMLAVLDGEANATNY